MIDDRIEQLTNGIDDRIEKLIPISAVPELMPKRNNKWLSYETIRLWTVEGHYGVLLEFVWRGGSKMTSREAVDRFNRRVNEVKQAERRLPGPAPTKINQAAAIAARQAIKEQFGI
jgi:hypothetical protein